MTSALMVLMTVFLAAAQPLDLAAIQAEGNPNHRSDKALEYASEEIEVARKAYAAGDVAKSKTALQQVLAATELSYNSLEEATKNPRRHSKYWKRAEVRVREMLRRLDGVAEDFDVDDRGTVQQVEQRMQHIHDSLLAGIMGIKNKK
jgi:DNA repair ATPase RecN